MQPMKTGRHLWRHLILALSISTITVCSVGQSNPAPDYSHYAQSYSLPYTEPVDFQHLTGTLKVKAQINGGAVQSFTVDTGSVGIVVGADDVPNIDPKAPAGMIRYSSSGVELHGVWTLASVTFPDAHVSGGMATAMVPVLAVSSETCAGTGVNAAICHPNDHPHPHMMGVGFGRGEEGHPEKNPFINLREMQDGTMRRGYVITPAGIQLGLTAANAGAGFVWQKLTERGVSADTASLNHGLKDWTTAPGAFRLQDKQSAQGTVTS